ncbi:response regulator [Rhizobium sp. SIMBA_035]
MPKKILIVEDEWLLASELARHVKGAGYEVVGPVPTTEDAAERINDDRPDAAILDVQLDGETTFSLAADLSVLGIPFFFLTGHTEKDYPQLEGRVILSKPAEVSLVLQTLADLVGET